MFYRRSWSGFVILCALALAVPAGSRAQAPDPIPAAWLSPPTDAGDLAYGPALDTPRKTLLQWSYGTHFGGGPHLEKPLQTDRPDFTETSSTVGRGVVQLEAGYTYFYDQDEHRSSTLHSIGEPLLRVGIGFDWLEFRVATNYLRESRRENGSLLHADGASDVYLGFKIALTPQEGVLPEIAVTPQMLLPTGSPPFTAPVIVTPGPEVPVGSRRLAAGVNWLYSWELSEQFTLGGSTQYNRTDDEETLRIYTEFAQSLVLHWTMTQSFDVYGEWYALLPIGADSVEPEHYLSAGSIYYLSKDLQVDIRGGVGLNDAAANCFVGVGGAVRF